MNLLPIVYRPAKTAVFLGLLWLTLVSPAAIPSVSADYFLSNGRHVTLQQSEVTWKSVNREITQSLQTKQLGRLAQEALTAPAPTNPKAWLYRFALLRRADYPDPLYQFLRARPSFMDTKTDWGLGEIIGWAGYEGDIRLAKQLCELFPEAGRPEDWFGKWSATVSPEEADRWLAARGKNNNKVWYYERLAFRARQGTEKELLAPLEKALREDPEDYAHLQNYVNAVVATGKPQTMEWVSSILQPRLAVQGYILASISNLPVNTQISLYEQTLALPFTKQDRVYDIAHNRKYRSHLEEPFEPWTEKEIRTWSTEYLLKLYDESGQAQKARNLRGDIVKKPVIRPQFPAAKREETDRGSAAEWQARAQQFSYPQDSTLTQEALDQALKRAPVPAKDGPSAYLYGEVVKAYARRLAVKSPKAAFEFIHRRLETLPMQQPLFGVLARELIGYSFRPHGRERVWGNLEIGSLVYDDPLLWRYLATRTDWRNDGELLGHLMQAAPQEKRDAQRLRAQSLLKGDALEQRFILADIVSNVQGQKSAIPLYRAILERTKNHPEWKVVKIRVLSKLFDAYIANEGFRGAADFRGLVEVDTERRKLEDDPVTPWFVLANTAARAGEKEEAVRYFTAGINEDRQKIGEWVCQRAAEMRMIPELRALCQEIEKKEPQCALPARIQKLLGDTPSEYVAP